MPELWLGEPQIPNSTLNSLHCQGTLIVFLFHIFISEVEAILNFVHPGHIHIAWWRLQIAQVSRENVAWKPYNYLWTCELWRLLAATTLPCAHGWAALSEVWTHASCPVCTDSQIFDTGTFASSVFLWFLALYIYIFVISAVASWPTFYWNIFKAQFSYILCW